LVIEIAAPIEPSGRMRGESLFPPVQLVDGQGREHLLKRRFLDGASECFLGGFLCYLSRIAFPKLAEGAVGRFLFLSVASSFF
jgi:hypothetical protein